jgi:hypothetical protein
VNGGKFGDTLLKTRNAIRRLSNRRSKEASVSDRRSGGVDEILSDDEIREKHRTDLSKAEEVLRDIKDGTADQTGIAGEELRHFFREHG